jgi:hypothetical protein
MTTCSPHPEAPKLVHKPKLYATDSNNQDIYRNGHVVKCSDIEFEDYTCIRTRELVAAEQEIIEHTYKCEKWKAQ